MAPLVLVIFDGFGISFEKKGNAIAAAKIPNLKYISDNFAGTLLQASGMEVGLSWGEMGSSEVGHANIGGGLVIYQNLSKINLAIQSGEFFKLEIWKKVVKHATENNSAIHLMGLVSNGGVHSHSDQLIAIVKTIKQLDFKGKVFIHVFTDGQDVAPASAMKFIEAVAKEIKKIKIGVIATICGRYYAMDKSENWDRTERAYNCLTAGVGKQTFSPEEAISESYSRNIKDENLEPTVIVDASKRPVGLIKDNDALIFFNFRADRARQITRAFTAEDFNKFPVKKMKNLFFVSMIQYGIGYPTESVYPPEHISSPLAKVVSDAGKTQIHIAEKEKYAHVTYFFNGGAEKEFPGEERVIIPSKVVSGYDQKPEMSAYEILDRVLEEIKKGKNNLIVVNFANGDIVGHTGNFKAGIKAVEVLDECIGKIYKEITKASGMLVITADHGNVEEMVNLETGEVDKEHSTNPVPLWIVSEATKKKAKVTRPVRVTPDGILADVAPTILELMGISKPMDMTGNSLLNIISDCPLPD